MWNALGHAVAGTARSLPDVTSFVCPPVRAVQALSGRPVGFNEVEPWLRPGDWELVLTRNGPTLSAVAAIRTGAAVPDHIVRPAFRRKGPNRSAAFIRRPFRVSLDATENILQADVWLIRHRGTWLLFDLERSEVLRWVTEPITEEYEALRRTFARHVPSVTFEVSRSRRSLSEPIVEGVTLHEVEAERQERVCRSLLRGLADLVREEVRPDVIGAGSQSFRRMARTSPITEAQQREDEFTELLGEHRVMVPVHGDLGGTNVLVIEEDHPVVIDFGLLNRGPFYVDPLSVARYAPRIWARGGFDDELGEIWEAAGLEPVRWDAGRIRLAGLARAPVRAAQRMRQTRPPFKALKRRVKAAQIRTKWERQAARLP